jgi:hypothetical protein
MGEGPERERKISYKKEKQEGQQQEVIKLAKIVQKMVTRKRRREKQ